MQPAVLISQFCLVVVGGITKHLNLSYRIWEVSVPVLYSLELPLMDVLSSLKSVIF